MIFNDKYEKEGDPIGKGYSGIIYKVLDKQTKNPYALKFIPIVNNDEFQEYESEIDVMKKIKSKYIIKNNKIKNNKIKLKNLDKVKNSNKICNINIIKKTIKIINLK